MSRGRAKVQITSVFSRVRVYCFYSPFHHAACQAVYRAVIYRQHRMHHVNCHFGRCSGGVTASARRWLIHDRWGQLARPRIAAGAHAMTNGRSCSGGVTASAHACWQWGEFWHTPPRHTAAFRLWSRFHSCRVHICNKRSRWKKSAALQIPRFASRELATDHLVALFSGHVQ